MIVETGRETDWPDCAYNKVSWSHTC